MRRLSGDGTRYLEGRKLYERGDRRPARDDRCGRRIRVSITSASTTRQSSVGADEVIARMRPNGVLRASAPPNRRRLPSLEATGARRGVRASV